MKKILVSLMMSLCILQAGFAADNINDPIIRAFNANFSEAKEVSWEYGDNYAKATFTLNGRTQYAFYTHHGELMGVAQYIRIDELPASLTELVKKNYPSYWISSLFELNSDDEKSYFITIENADQTLILKNNRSFGWSLFKRTVK